MGSAAGSGLSRGAVSSGGTTRGEGGIVVVAATICMGLVAIDRIGPVLNHT